jgi:hypothetical protein
MAILVPVNRNRCILTSLIFREVSATVLGINDWQVGYCLSKSKMDMIRKLR